MDVEAAARCDVAKRADADVDQIGDQPNDSKRDQKSERGKEQSLAALALEVEAIARGEQAP